MSRTDVVIPIDPLLLPISDDAPSGVPMRYEPEYDQIREARREDDASLPSGIWQSTLKRGDWATVEQLATDVIRKRSKDLMIAVWLGEAWQQRHGLAGLEAALALLTELSERFWDTVHPQIRDGDLSFRAGPLEWAARAYAETLVIGVPLIGDDAAGDVGRITLADWQALTRKQLLTGTSKTAKAEQEEAKQTAKQYADAIRTLAGNGLRRNAERLAASRAWLAKLDDRYTEHMGNEAPSFAALRETIDQMMQVVQEFIAMQPAPEPPPPPVVAAAEPTPAASQPDPAPAMTATQLNNPVSRDDAYRQLLLIADYLSKTEPHSPVPYLIYRAVEWGQKPLRDLLAELISSDAEARRLWSLLGVLP
ncbi:type VI secretion system protein TssA [Andreprevotia chitinilytica]|uniref:type VI secretion system protein TssA n=1 Tax=Andreprevotia chitinilytica TaxID=396808 RepID=UPI000559844A|nr:type VI secretion system protein TssA [Andreprevotia chitinilytica]